MNEARKEWQRLYSEAGNLLYEGFTFNNKPCGAGEAYYPDGTVYREGIFGVKGLLCGREYYPNGKLRYEGTFGINCNYGPNYPKCGMYQSEDEAFSYEGNFRIRFTGVGYPLMVTPNHFGSVLLPGSPKIPVLMWNDLKDSANPR